ncbi:uncharacterized protein BP5553_10300 [Venustampulla echinocandica]|uniref:Peptidase A1 domain-containing protein n=1 Tax=Venustampulla echinocandica TaxID=2656787 RepID=A0A370T9W0_9HELO|nr:uncharacterized protein BP5553_10300 [Venustampulla echinocandica]RDL30422.1 hypothetical protein BP5553_10300 [Venustampulla echinocandica]
MAEPSCLGVDYSNKFFSPEFGTVALSLTISADQNVQVSWWGGKNDSGTVQVVSLWLVCRQRRMVIVDSGSFIFGSSPSSNWTYLDDCGNTKLSYNWTVPDYADLVSGFNIMSDVQFSFMASNQTANVTSPSFSIVKAAAFTSTTSTSSSSSIISTNIPNTLSNPSDTSTTPSPTASLSYPKKSNSTSLSTGAKAGIGIGCVAFVLVFLGVFIYMKRRRTKDELSKQQSEKFEKPELSGETAPNRPVEIEGAEIHEMDTQAKERPPRELASG